MPVIEAVENEQNAGLDLSVPEIRRNTAHPGDEPHKRYSFDGIQVLRAVAALFVVAMHGTADWTNLAYGEDVASHIWFAGSSGVDIFFIISGFVMAVSTYGRTNGEPPQVPRAAGDFLLRRLIRIAPLYWLFLSLRILKTVLQQMHVAFNHAPLHPMSTSYIVQSYLFIPAFNSVHQPQPPLVVGWTLSFEMFFYVLLAIALKGRLRVEKFLLPIMIPLSILGLFYNNTWPAVASLLRSTLLLEFLAGLLLGLWIVRGHQVPQKQALVCGAIGLLLLLLTPFDVSISPIRGLWWGTMAFGLVSGSLALEKHLAGRWPRVLVFLGDASYSIYLSHYLFFDAVRGALEHLGLAQTGRAHEVAFTLLLLTAGLIGGVFCYVLIERPMNDFLRQRFFVPKAEATPVVTTA